MSKLFLALPVVLMAGASHAAIIQYDFKSPEMKFATYTVDGVEKTKPAHMADVEWFTTSIRIDTDQIENGRLDVNFFDGELPKGMLGAHMDIYQEYKIGFDADWNITDSFVSFDSDGTARWAQDGLSASHGMVIDDTQIYWSYTALTNGSWTKTVLVDANDSLPAPTVYYRNIEAPAPVPLPASALLLLGGLASFGAVRRFRK